MSIPAAAQCRNDQHQTSDSDPRYCACGAVEYPNPIVRTTVLSAYPGWSVSKYADGTFCAFQPNGVAMSPVERSFADAVYFAKHGHPVSR